MTLKRLPPEILERILIFSLDADRGQALDFICVCKEWLNTAYSLLYENIHITSLNKLGSLRNAILDRSSSIATRPIPSTDIGYVVLRFEVVYLGWPTSGPSTGEVEEAASTITALLHHFIRLQHFTWLLFDEWRSCKLPILSTLVRLRKDTCTSLMTTVFWNDKGTFSAINELGHLREIVIMVVEPEMEPDDFEMDDFDWTHHPRDALSLPCATKVMWNVACDASTPMLEFMAACSFGPQCNVELIFNDVDEGSEVSLLPLFARNQIRELNISAPPALLNALAPAIVNIDTVTLEFYEAPLEITRQETLPRCLSLRSVAMPAEDCLWAFLDELERSSSVLKVRSAIQIYREKILFSWHKVGVDSGHAQFIARLSSIADLLTKKNIQVVDRDGADCAAILG